MVTADISHIVSVAMRVYQGRGAVFLDGAQDRILTEVNQAAHQHRNEQLDAVRRAVEGELDFSRNHPFFAGMFFDMGR